MYKLCKLTSKYTFKIFYKCFPLEEQLCVVDSSKISEITGIQEIWFLGFMLRLIDMPF
jgi:hypothetical protein